MTATGDYRSYLPPQLAEELRRARVELGLSGREAAMRAGICPAYFSHLERGMRCPSTAVAESLIKALSLPGDTAARLRKVARPDAGRRSPYASARSAGGRSYGPRSQSRPDVRAGGATAAGRLGGGRCP